MCGSATIKDKRVLDPQARDLFVPLLNALVIGVNSRHVGKLPHLTLTNVNWACCISCTGPRGSLIKVIKLLFYCTRTTVFIVVKHSLIKHSCVPLLITKKIFKCVTMETHLFLCSRIVGKLKSTITRNFVILGTIDF